MEKTVKTARQLVEEVGMGVVSVAPEESVLAVLQAMAERDVSGVLVLAGQQLAGIVTARDYALKVELQGRTAKDTRAREIMTREVIWVAAADSCEHCRSLMHNRRVRHLPVLEGGRVIGMVSMRDVLEQVVAADEQCIRDLEHERIESGGNTGGSY